MKILFKYILVSFLLFSISGNLLTASNSFALGEGNSAVSDNSGANCYSLDVVFLVDQSGSMSSPFGLMNANDPNGLRKSSADWIIDWLGDNVLTYCPEAIHRIAVISWGDKAITDLVGVISPRTIQEWSVTRDGLKAQIKLQNLGETVPDIAFTEAKNTLSDLESQPLGDLPRKRVIVFVTDGVPTVGGSSNISGYSTYLIDKVEQLFPFDSGLMQQEKCLAIALIDAKKAGQNVVDPKAKNQCLKDNPIGPTAVENSTYIWSILLNANNGVPYKQYIDFYNAMDKISQEHAGYVTSIVRSSDIPVKFLDIMTALVGVKAERLGCQSFAMEPYLQQATLSFFKVDKDITVEISYKDGNNSYSVTQNDLINNSTWPKEIPGFTVKDYTNDNTIERYAFQYPHAGNWSIRASDCNGIQAFFEPLDIGTELLSPPSVVPEYDLNPYYDQSAPVYIEYQLVNQGTTQGVMEPDPRFPLTITATLIKPGGETENLSLQYDSATKTYRSESPLKVNVVGKYQFSVEGVTPYLDTSIGSMRTLVEDGPRYFEVSPVTPFKISISEPEPNQNYPLHGDLRTGLSVRPFTFHVALTDRNGKTIDPSLILLNPNKSLTGSVSGVDQSFNVPLILDPKDPTQFMGQLASIQQEGNYHFSVSIASKVSGENPYIAQYHPDSNTVGVDFVVRDSLFTRPITYKFLGIAFLLFIIAGIVITGLNRNNPVTGTLVFEIGATNIADIQIGTGWNVSRISRRTLQAYSSLGLKSLKAQKSKQQLGYIDYSAIDMNGNPYSGTLMPESTTPFAGGMTVRYESLESQ